MPSEGDDQPVIILETFACIVDAIPSTVGKLFWDLVYRSDIPSFLAPSLTVAGKVNDSGRLLSKGKQLLEKRQIETDLLSVWKNTLTKTPLETSSKLSSLMPGLNDDTDLISRTSNRVLKRRASISAKRGRKQMEGLTVGGIQHDVNDCGGQSATTKRVVNGRAYRSETMTMTKMD